MRSVLSYLVDRPVTRSVVLTLAGLAGLTVAASMWRAIAGVIVGSLCVLIFEYLTRPEDGGRGGS